MIVELDSIPNRLNPEDRKTKCRVAFMAEAVSSVREIPTVDEGVFHTKIVFRGDLYEHHAIETEKSYDEILIALGWRKSS